jgi:hypothetical protein
MSLCFEHEYLLSDQANAIPDRPSAWSALDDHYPFSIKFWFLLPRLSF